MFPPNEHKLLLEQLASSIEAIISQRLVPARDGKLRPAVEILRGSAVSQKLILENRLAELHDFIATGDAGMQTFDQHLIKLYHEDLISGPRRCGRPRIRVSCRWRCAELLRLVRDGPPRRRIALCEIGIGG